MNTVGLTSYQLESSPRIILAGRIASPRAETWQLWAQTDGLRVILDGLIMGTNRRISCSLVESLARLTAPHLEVERHPIPSQAVSTILQNLLSRYRAVVACQSGEIVLAAVAVKGGKTMWQSK